MASPPTLWIEIESGGAENRMRWRKIGENIKNRMRWRKIENRLRWEKKGLRPS